MTVALQVFEREVRIVSTVVEVRATTRARSNHPMRARIARSTCVHACPAHAHETLPRTRTRTRKHRARGRKL